MEFEEISTEEWKPENAGDSIEGKYIRKKECVGRNEANVYYIENNKKKYLIWGTTILDDRMEFVNIGDYIMIEYRGTVPSKKGNDLKLFKLLRAKNETN